MGPHEGARIRPAGAVDRRGSRDEAELAGYTVVDSPSIIATHLTEVIRCERPRAPRSARRQETPRRAQRGSRRPGRRAHPRPAYRRRSAAGPAKPAERRHSHPRSRHNPRGPERRGPRHQRSDLLDGEGAGGAGPADFTTVHRRTGLHPRVTLDPALEQEIADALRTYREGTYDRIAPERVEAFYDSLTGALERAAAMGHQAVLLCSPLIRPRSRG